MAARIKKGDLVKAQEKMQKALKIFDSLGSKKHLEKVRKEIEEIKG